MAIAVLLTATPLGVVAADHDGGALPLRDEAAWTRQGFGLPTAIAFADVTGDARPEALLGAQRGVVAVDGETGARVWTRQLPAGTSRSVASLAAGDLDGDGGADVLAGSLDGAAYALHGDTGAALWTVDTLAQAGRAYGSVNAVALANATGDGRPEAFLGGSAGVSAHGPDGALRWADRDAPNVLCLTTGDLDGDGDADVLAGTVTDARAYDADTGALLWRVAARDGVLSCHVGDLTGDGAADALAVAWGSEARALDGGTGATQWSAALPHIARAAAVGDVTGDGAPDALVATHDGAVNALDGRDGALLWNATMGDDADAVALADLDGDGRAEALAGSWDHHVYAWGPDGAPLWRVATRGEATVLGAADLDLDGAPEVVAGVGAHVSDTVGFPEDLEPPTGSPHYDFRYYALAPTGEALWDAPLLTYADSLATLDTNGDGVLDVVEGNGDHWLYARDGNTGERVWRLHLGARPRALATLDATGDGAPELAVVSDNGKARLLTAAGDVVWTYAAGPDPTILPALATGDFDGDGLDDVAVGAMSGHVAALRGATGEALWTHEAPSGVLDVAAGDLNGDGTPDVVVGLGREVPADVMALDGAPGPVPVDLPQVPYNPFVSDPRVLWTYDHAWHVTTVAVATGDHPPRVVAGSSGDHLLHGIDGESGAPAWTYPLLNHPADLVVAGDAVFASSRNNCVAGLHALTGAARWDACFGEDAGPLAVADATGDGAPEVFAGIADGRIVALDAALGQVLGQHDAHGVYASLAAADLDGDGAVEAVGGSRDYNLYTVTFTPQDDA